MSNLIANFTHLLILVISSRSSKRDFTKTCVFFRNKVPSPKLVVKRFLTKLIAFSLSTPAGHLVPLRYSSFPLFFLFRHCAGHLT